MNKDGERLRAAKVGPAGVTGGANELIKLKWKRENGGSEVSPCKLGVGSSDVTRTMKGEDSTSTWRTSAWDIDY